MNKLYFLSGAPRTGSKLLASILNQNPLFHLEQTSPLCRILWSLKQSFDSEITQNEFFAANKKNKDIEDLFWSIIKNYYKNVGSEYIFDKHGSWTIEANYQMIIKYLNISPKIIVTNRNIEDIVKSYVYVYIKNGFSQNYAENILLNLDNRSISPILRPIAGTIWVQFTKNKNYHILSYDDLIENPKKEIDKIYNFLDLKIYGHNYKNIKFLYPENENFIFKNLMEVRETINKRQLNIFLSKQSLNKIKKISELMEKSSEENIVKNDAKKIINFYKENINY
jgi:sulfotransferase